MPFSNIRKGLLKYIKTVFFNTPMISPNPKLLVKCNDVGHLPTKIWLYDSDMNMCMNLHISSFCWRNKSHSNTTIIPEDKRKMFYQIIVGNFWFTDIFYQKDEFTDLMPYEQIYITDLARKVGTLFYDALI